MNKTIIGLILALFIFSCAGFSFAAEGIFHGNYNATIINDDGTNHTYDAMCVQQHELIDDHNTHVPVRNEVKVRNGTIEYILDNWDSVRNLNDTADRNPYNDNAWTKFQTELWKITENQNIPYVTYGENGVYVVNRTVGTPTVTTSIQLINGSNFTVSKIINHIETITFRMLGDGYNCIPGETIQDLLVWRGELFDEESYNYILIPHSEVPEENTTNHNTTVDNDTTVNDENDTNDTLPPKEPINATEPNETVTPTNDTTPTVTPPANPGHSNDTEPTAYVAKESVTKKNKSVAEDNVTPTAAAGTAMKNTGAPLIAVLLVLLASAVGIVNRKK